eukprot:15360683-Ditylum_brightwellii.AAC.1
MKPVIAPFVCSPKERIETKEKPQTHQILNQETCYMWTSPSLILHLAEDSTVHKCFIYAIQKEGKTVIDIRIDEEGAISRGAEFTSMMIDEFPGIKMNTSGGHASWLNGKIEQPHETIKDGT